MHIIIGILILLILITIITTYNSITNEYNWMEKNKQYWKKEFIDMDTKYGTLIRHLKERGYTVTETKIEKHTELTLTKKKK